MESKQHAPYIQFLPRPDQPGKYQIYQTKDYLRFYCLCIYFIKWQNQLVLYMHTYLTSYTYCYCILSLLISMSKDKPKAIVSENLSLSMYSTIQRHYSTVSFMLQSYFMHSCLHFKLRTCQNSIYIYMYFSFYQNF